MIGISITGHLGGTLTHGEGYLFSGAGSAEAAVQKPVINDIAQAKVYADLVAPLLQEKCYSCHGASKQKGKLRMDKPEFLLKGGENGVILKAGNWENSEMIKRILLPRQHEDHMPPKEKGQLSENEIALLKWWVKSGTSFDKTVNMVFLILLLQQAILYPSLDNRLIVSVNSSLGVKLDSISIVYFCLFSQISLCLEAGKPLLFESISNFWFVFKPS